MTETIPKPCEGGAGADDASESDPLLLLDRGPGPPQGGMGGRTAPP
jgi:hypothetical protein